MEPKPTYKVKRPYKVVSAIAAQLVDALKPVCERIEIAGSLRRRRPLIGDIEILVIPKFQLDIFREPSKRSELEDLLDIWRETAVFTKDGERYKQIRFETVGGAAYQLDLFVQDTSTWGVNMMIRTGPSDFSRKMVTRRSVGGLMPDDLRVAGARVYRGGDVLQTPEEGDVFKLWGMKYIRPEKR